MTRGSGPVGAAGATHRSDHDRPRAASRRPRPGAEEPSFDLELETGACYFNGAAYPIGDYVRSGSELLHCEERGVWVRVGEMRPSELASG
jgi:hypothetical protein